MSYNGFRALLITGFLGLVSAQKESVEFCNSKRGFMDFSAYWNTREIRFQITGNCEWEDESLVLMIEGGDCQTCRMTLQGQTIWSPPSRTCFVISKNFNESANPTETFTNCVGIVWAPLKHSKYVLLKLSRQQQRIGLHYKFASRKPTKSLDNEASAAVSNNGAVIALAILLTVALIALFTLLIIMFKQRFIELGKNIRSRFDKQTTKSSDVQEAPASNSVYAVAEELSIYQEVGAASQKELVQNELYAMT